MAIPIRATTAKPTPKPQGGSLTQALLQKASLAKTSSTAPRPMGAQRATQAAQQGAQNAAAQRVRAGAAQTAARPGGTSKPASKTSKSSAGVFSDERREAHVGR
jgi:hypothetical protein